MSGTGLGGWFSNKNVCVYSTSPFFIRGGTSLTGGTGLFSAESTAGRGGNNGSSYNNGFRVTLVP